MVCMESATTVAEPSSWPVRRLAQTSSSRSRFSGTRERNCQITTSAEDTSTKESRPKPSSATDDAATPAVTATTPSIRL
jgi:hypothetical protein